METGTIFFYLIAAVVIGTSLGMVISRNAIYSALFLVLNFGAVAALYITLGAPFIAMAQITVYAGAIMVLFLFVIMLLGAEMLADEWQNRKQHLLAILIALIFLGETIWLAIVNSGLPVIGLEMPSADYATPAQIGMSLFSSYLLPFEITSFILLAAIIGAVVLTRGDIPIKRLIRSGKE